MGDTAAELGPWAANLVNLGFVGWLSWYLTTKSIPRLVEDFRVDMRLERELFAKTIDTLTGTFNAEQEANRKHCSEEIRATNERWREIWTSGFKQGARTVSPGDGGVIK